MGTPPDEPGRADNERAPRAVTLAAFALGRTPVTRAEYAAFVRASGWDTDRGSRTGERGCFVGVTVRGPSTGPRSCSRRHFSRDDLV